ncbi:heme-binding protein [Chryseolinea sp. H1M3-3]|uniref:GlcG/HbpS family heme-binding protein n=1 Tax=Chryseolinea sp. H1M3-3 TaxID=3034144 RepID=UPI0023ED3FA9|nr:heme-binding protein [Chryseolinea sp. H1M3-3]
MKIKLVLILTLISVCTMAQNQPSTAPPVPMYGESITLENARKILSAAEAFAKSKQWPVAIAIVDIGGNLVAFERIDNTQVASIDIAIAKAKTANNFKRTTKVLEDAVAGGGAGLRVLSIPGALPLEGGEPIYANGKIIGGIGVSGMQSGQDAEVVKAGLAVVK